MISTKHFNSRVKDRVGLGKNNNYLPKALENGVYLENVTCRPSLYNYLCSLLVSEQHGILMHNHYMIVYDKHNNTAITILNIPKRFHSTLKSIYKNKRGNRNE